LVTTFSKSTRGIPPTGGRLTCSSLISHCIMLLNFQGAPPSRGTAARTTGAYITPFPDFGKSPVRFFRFRDAEPSARHPFPGQRAHTIHGYPKHANRPRVFSDIFSDHAGMTFRSGGVRRPCAVPNTPSGVAVRENEDKVRLFCLPHPPSLSDKP
jgi:hypothetical protein